MWRAFDAEGSFSVSEPINSIIYATGALFPVKVYFFLYLCLVGTEGRTIGRWKWLSVDINLLKPSDYFTYREV